MRAVHGPHTVLEERIEFRIVGDVRVGWLIDTQQANIIVVEGGGREKEQHLEEIATGMLG